MSNNNDKPCEQRVSLAQMKEFLPYIVAVDADGTLWEDDWTKPLGNGWINHELIHALITMRAKDTKIVLWTCRNGKALAEAVAFCLTQGLVFDAVNANIPEVVRLFGSDTRKVYANIYIDDKAQLPPMPKAEKEGRD